MKPEEFIAAIAPAAQASAKVSKIPASFTIAEGALESGWGASQLALQAFNLFGVKADKAWHGDVLTMRTRECLHGKWVMVNALWRKYRDWQGCIDDHAAFLIQNYRYRSAFEHTGDAEAFTNAIASAGYATDPDYAKKILSVIHAHHLIQYDKAAA